MDIGSLTGQVAIQDQLTDKLEGMIHHIKHFASEFEGMAGTVFIAGGVIAAAVTGAVISIVEMGEKGSVLLGVENAFDRLAESAGTTGEALRGSLSEGVKGTIGEMTLMQSTMRLMSSGMKLNTDQARLMGEASRALGKATGGDAASGLSTLSSALITGRVIALQQQIGLINLAAGEKKFADSIGTTVGQLNEAGKLEGKRIAILDATKAYVDRLGVSELSLKERIQQSKVAMEEWKEKLEKSVASSPHVLAAYDAISNAIKNAFGGANQTLQEWIITWVNRFADAVTKWGPIIINTMAGIVAKIREIYTEIIHSWDTAPEWFKNIARDALIAGLAVRGVSLATQGMTGTDVLSALSNVAQIWSVIGTNVGSAIVQVKEIGAALKLTYTMGGLRGLLTGISGGLAVLAATPVGIAAMFTALGAAMWQVVKAIQAFGDNWNAGGGTLWGFLSLKDDNNFVRRWLDLSSGIDGAAASIDKVSGATTHATSALANFNAVIHDQVMVSLGEMQDQLRVNWTGAVAEETAYWMRIKTGFNNVTSWAKSAGESIGLSLFSDYSNQETAYWNRLKAGFSSVADWLAKRRKDLESGMLPSAPSAPSGLYYGLGAPNIKSSSGAEVAQQKQDSEAGRGAAGFLKAAGPNAYDTFVKSLKSLTENIDTATAHHMPLTEQMKMYGSAATKAAEDAAAWGTTVSSSIQKVANVANDKSFKEFQNRIAAKPLTSMPGVAVADVMAPYTKMLDEMKKLDLNAAATHERSSQAVFDYDISLAQRDISSTKTTLTQKLEATGRYYALLHDKATAGYNFEREQIIRSTNDSLKAIDKTIFGWEGLEAAIKTAGEASLTALDTNNGITQLKIDLDKAAAAADTLKQTFLKAFQSIPQTLISAFEGGGGLLGALKSLAVQFGQTFGKAMSDAIAKQLNEDNWGVKGGGYTGSAISGKTMGLALAGGALAGGSAAASGASTAKQVGAVGSAAANTAMMVYATTGSIAASAALATFTAGAGLAVIAAVKIYKAMNDGRRVMQDYFKTFQGGSDELRQRMLVLGDAGEMMWKRLTQQTGKGDKAGAQLITKQINAALAAYGDSPQAMAETNYQTRDDLQKIADKAKAVYEYMLASGKYTATAIADAFQKSKDATIAAMSDEGKAHADAMDAITARYATMFDKIDTEYKTLSTSVANEAEEAVMGSVEIQERARMKQLEGDKAALEAKKAAEELTANATYDAWVKAGADADKALRELFAKGYTTKLTIERAYSDGSGDGPPPVHMATGGVVPFTPYGTDTVPAMLTPGETVIPAGMSRGGGTAIIELNGRTIAEVIVPELPGVYKRYGIRA